MQTAMYLKTTVLPGGQIDVTNLKLPRGETVELFIILPPFASVVKPSAIDILTQAPGHRLFQTAAAVNRYMKAEHDSWER